MGTRAEKFAVVDKDVPRASWRATVCATSCWIHKRLALLNVCVWGLLGEGWIVLPINRLTNLTWWIASSGNDTAKAFGTDIYGSALSHCSLRD